MTSEEFKIKTLPFNSKLLGFANRFMNDLDEAKDVVQEIYIKLWRMRDELDKYNSIEALAMRMTRNLCLDKIKLKKTVKLNGIEHNLVEQKDDYKQEELSIAANRAKNAIKQLDEPQKTIMELRDVQGYDYEEISEILNMNVNTVRVNLSRARKKVKEYLLSKYYNHGSTKNKSSIREIL